jgi:hypothetical protein
MEQNEVSRSGGKSSTLESPQEDNPIGGSRTSSSSASENRSPKKASGLILDPSGDPADRAAELERGRSHLDGLTADAMQLVTDKPLGAAVTAFGLGLVLGLVLGILIGRD